MTVEVDVEVGFGPIIAIPVTVAASSESVAVGRCKLYGYSLFENSNAGFPSTVRGASGTFTAAAAGSVALPAAADTLTGFDVTAAPVAAEVAGTVTVSNVIGGPYNYDFAMVVGNTARLSVTYPLGLSPSGGTPTVSINAITGGSAGNINVYGRNNINSVIAHLTDGNQDLAEIILGSGGILTQWFGPGGIKVMGQLTLACPTGSLTGVVYVAQML